LILGIPIAFLDFAFELVTSAVDSSKVVIGELAPLLFDLARELFPTSFNPIPIHCNLLVLFGFVGLKEGIEHSFACRRERDLDSLSHRWRL
jgi:hypothetical protein